MAAQAPAAPSPTTTTSVSTSQLETSRSDSGALTATDASFSDIPAPRLPSSRARNLRSDAHPARIDGLLPAEGTHVGDALAMQRLALDRSESA
jgi:hypothetical protein